MNTAVQDRFATIKANYKNLFQQFEQGLNGLKEEAIHAYRRKAIERLEGLDFPGRKNEDWKYTPTTRVLQPAYTLATATSIDDAVIAAQQFGDLDAHLIVFNNGVWDMERSKVGELPAGLEISTIGKALQAEAHQEQVEKVLKEWSEGTDAFAALNVAFSKDGVFIKVAANTVLTKPIYLLHINTTTETPSFNHPQRMVIVDKSSQCTVIERYTTPAAPQTYFTNSLNRMQVGANAHLIHYKIQEEATNSFQINQTDVIQDRDSTYTSHVLDLGGRLIRNNLRSHLKDSGTNTNLYGVYLPTGDQHIDNQSFIDHAFPHCESNELYKGVIDDRGRGVFNGKVLVREDAQKTNAFQQNSSLVLSDQAVMDSKPQLEIFADDVKCSHGATIGQLDEEALFYMRSRGLNKDQARALLQQAFLSEVTEKMEINQIRTTAEALMSQKFSNK